MAGGAVRYPGVERENAAYARGHAPDHAPDHAIGFSLEHLSDGELLASTRSMVGRSNLIQAALLSHLAEVEARGLYRERACSSLYTYCVYELRMSEDMAQRRAAAAKQVRRFPILLERIAAGELHMTGLLLLGPHLTDENLKEVLSLAKHRSKREIAKLVRRLDPLPDFPARVEPLGSSGGSMENPTWLEAMEALAPVRHLRAGDRPSDWLPADEALTKTPLAALERSAAGHAPAAASVLSTPQRYGVQFTAGEDYVQLLEEARDLLGRATEGRSIEAGHLRAMRLLVRELEKRKCAETEKPRTQPDTDPRQRGSDHAAARSPRQRGAAQEVAADVPRRSGAARKVPAEELRRRGANVVATQVQRQRGAAQEVAADVPRRRGSDSAATEVPRQRASAERPHRKAAMCRRTYDARCGNETHIAAHSSMIAVSAAASAADWSCNTKPLSQRVARPA